MNIECSRHQACWIHYNDVIMTVVASQIISLTIVYSPIYSGANQRKHQSSASLAFMRGIHRWPVNSPHIGPITQKIFPFDDVIMIYNTSQEICIPFEFCCGQVPTDFIHTLQDHLNWQWGNIKIVPVPVKQLRRTWLNWSHDSIGTHIIGVR